MLQSDAKIAVTTLSRSATCVPSAARLTAPTVHASVTAEACSATVLHALRKDRPMVFVPRTLRVLYALRPFAYPLIKRILTGAAGSQGQNT